MINERLNHLKYCINVLIRNPNQLLSEIFRDIKKDISAKYYNSQSRLVWCVGLPKSGTTLIENILDELPYVRMNMSLKRLYSTGNLSHPHDLSNEMIQYHPKKCYSYIKTHSHFDLKYIQIAKKHEAKLIISMRDLRDMMISNYNHIKNNSKAWEHKIIEGLSREEGFIKTLKIYDTKIDNEEPLKYYYKWIVNWKRYAKQHNILLLWYEDYKKNPEEYITKILKYLDFNEFDASKIETNINNLRLSNTNLLKTNLNKPGRSVSTFNEGKTNVYKSFFNKKIENEFYNMLPLNPEESFYE